jgi:hypothetical protein
MWLACLVLFIALCPGVIFTAPLGKKMGGKLSIAVVHAIVFVIIVNILDVCLEGLSDGFNTSLKWTKSGNPPSDPGADVTRYQALVNVRQTAFNKVEGDLEDAKEDLVTAQTALSQFEPSGSTFRAKCLSVRNSSCPTMDSQERLFGADDCATLGAQYNANGKCEASGNGVNYSKVCGVILNRLPPQVGQDSKCVAARAALTNNTSGSTFRSLMTLATTGSGAESCGRNQYYGAVANRCVACSTAPPTPGSSMDYNPATKASINAKCAPTSAAWKKVNPSGSGTR